MRRGVIAAGAVAALILFGVAVFLAERDSENGAPAAGATPALARGQVVIDFASSSSPRPKVMRDFAVAEGSTAWEAIRQALGAENVSARDAGPSLGMFVTGFYGVAASGNQFWEFLINGRSAELGVSSYKVKSGDVLEFRISTF